MKAGFQYEQKFLKGERPAIDGACIFKTLIKQCWAQKPEERLVIHFFAVFADILFMFSPTFAEVWKGLELIVAPNLPASPVKLVIKEPENKTGHVAAALNRAFQTSVSETINCSLVDKNTYNSDLECAAVGGICCCTERSFSY